MKDKFLQNLHFIVLIYALFKAYSLYDNHQQQLTILELDRSKIKKQVDEKGKKIKEIEKFQVEVGQHKDKIKELQGQVDLLKIKLPSDSQQTEVLQELVTQANELNLRETTFSPKYKKPKGIYITNGLELKGMGTFLQLLIFFEKLGASQRIYNVASVKITNRKEKNRGRLNLVNAESVVETYQFNEEFKEESLKKVATPKSKVVPRNNKKSKPEDE